MHSLRSTRQSTHRALLLGSILALVGSLLAMPAAGAQVVPKRCEIVGTPGPDVLRGTDGDDIICGMGGDDTIYGEGGDDELLGGDGNDVIIGGPGHDLLRGDAGKDDLFGGPGRDVLRGGNDKDNLVGGSEADVLRGGNGDDTLAGGSGHDVLRGGNGNDDARGAGGDDLVFGGPGDDLLRGGSGNDRLRGGPEADICVDSFAKTNGVNCEFGRGGDDRGVAIGQQLWSLFGHNEFAYELTITTPCQDGECGASAFADTVRVVGDEATSAFGVPAYTAADLFALAEAAEGDGQKVSYDKRIGLPTRIDNIEGASLAIDSIHLRDALRGRYNAAVARWNAAAISDYSYTVSTSCFCPFTAPIRVTVSNGSEVTSEPLGEGETTWTGGALTIDDHLLALGEALDSLAINIRADFNESGVPLLVWVNQSNQIADEERAITISDFVDATTPASDDDQGDEEELVAPDLDDEDPESPDPTVKKLPKVETVTVRGIEVNVVIADQVEALLAASDDAGLSLSGGGFRDPQRQIELRKKNCGTSDFAIYEMPASQCNPPTARPGQSQHEVGLAIDFTNEGRLITTRSDPAFVWLAENAGKFGFINLPSEPWHWSTTGN